MHHHSSKMEQSVILATCFQQANIIICERGWKNTSNFAAPDSRRSGLQLSALSNFPALFSVAGIGNNREVMPRWQADAREARKRPIDRQPWLPASANGRAGGLFRI